MVTRARALTIGIVEGLVSGGLGSLLGLYSFSHRGFKGLSLGDALGFGALGCFLGLLIAIAFTGYLLTSEKRTAQNFSQVQALVIISVSGFAGLGLTCLAVNWILEVT